MDHKNGHTIRYFSYPILFLYPVGADNRTPQHQLFQPGFEQIRCRMNTVSTNVRNFCNRLWLKEPEFQLALVSPKIDKIIDETNMF